MVNSEFDISLILAMSTGRQTFESIDETNHLVHQSAQWLDLLLDQSWQA